MPLKAIIVDMEELIAWVDIETTGIRYQDHDIIEFALVLTDTSLTEVAHYRASIRATKDILSRFSPFAREMHEKNGLLEECINNPTLESVNELPSALKRFLSDLGIEDATSFRIAGSSVLFDRGYLRHHAPEVDEMFHYRSIDGSSLKETCRLFFPEIYNNRPENTGGHRASGDIRSSIKEYKFYVESLKN